MRGSCEQIAVMLVAGDEPQIVVEHAQAVRHVAERGVEMAIALAQLMLVRKQNFVLPPQLGDRCRRIEEARDGGLYSLADHSSMSPPSANIGNYI